MNNFLIYVHGTTFGCIVKTLSAIPWSRHHSRVKGTSTQEMLNLISETFELVLG
jgi:hypothetical protein